jgi:hypothetical protein
VNTFNIRMGIPEMEAVWNDLTTRHEQGQLSGNEQKFFKKLVKALGYLEINPKHNSLESHEIAALTRRYGVRVWQSYLENRTPSAGRIFWAYGPGKGEITILAVEPHPEDQKHGGYDRIKLSDLPTGK